MSASGIRAGAVNVSDKISLLNSTTFAPEPGVTITSLDIQYHREGAASPALKVDATAGTLGTHADNTISEVDATNSPGIYEVNFPDAMFAPGARSVTVMISGAGLAPANLRYEIDHGAYNDAIHYDDVLGTTGAVKDINGTERYPAKDEASVSTLLGFFPGYAVACRPGSTYVLEAAYGDQVFMGSAGTTMNTNTQDLTGNVYIGFDFAADATPTGSDYSFIECALSANRKLPGPMKATRSMVSAVMTLGTSGDYDFDEVTFKGSATFAGGAAGVVLNIFEGQGHFTLNADTTDIVVNVYGGSVQFTDNSGGAIINDYRAGGTVSVPTVGAIADAVWDEASAGHTVAGSTGAVLASRSSHTAADVWAVGSRTLTSFGTLVSDVWSHTTRILTAGTNIVLAKGTGVTGFNDPTAVAVRTEIDTNSTKLDVAVSTRSSHTAADIWAVGSRTLTSFGTLVSDIWNHATRVLTAGTNIVLAKGTGVTGFNDPSAIDIRTEMDTNSSKLDEAVSTRLATSSYVAPNNALISAIAGYIDTEVASILATAQKIDTMLETDGAVYRFTVNALEQAPAGGGGGSGSGDPLLNVVPGSYESTTAGYALGRLLETKLRLDVATPILLDGSVTVMRGDDYKAADSRALMWEDSNWPDLTGATIEFVAGTFSKAGTIIQASSPGIVQIELDDSETTTFPVGRLIFQVRATLANTNKITLVSGAMTVS